MKSADIFFIKSEVKTQNLPRREQVGVEDFHSGKSSY